MGAHREARIPVEAGVGQAADAAHQRRVLRLAAEAGREAAGKAFVEREAVGIGPHGGQAGGVGDVVDDRHHRAAAGARLARLGPQPVAHEQRLSAVRAEDAAARIRVAEEEAAGHLLARVVRVGVELDAGGERVAEVPEQLQIVVDLRRAPDLRRVRHDVRVPRGEQRDGIAAGGAPVGGVRAAVLQAQVGEPGGAERQADVAGDMERLPVALLEGARVELERSAGVGVLELEVHDAGDGVRAVLGGRAVAPGVEPSEAPGVGPARVRAQRGLGEPARRAGLRWA